VRKAMLRTGKGPQDILHYGEADLRPAISSRFG
jgi:hypothetical protein